MTSYSSLGDITHHIDVILVEGPERGVYSVLENVGENNIRNVVVYSSGFSKAGEKVKEILS